ANTPLPQYVGLASEFELVDVNVHWDARLGRYGLRLDLNYLRNLEFDAEEIWTRAAGNIVNNFGGTGGTTLADFESGGEAYMLEAAFDMPGFRPGSTWRLLAGYKRIEPDALPDAYNDTTFHLGGTNARGYYLETAYALHEGVWLGARWTASKEVYGAPLAIDTLQIELNARF
ncbi:MAG: hypothetical protein DIU71_16145, partial [Proteobacteria bacterium]